MKSLPNILAVLLVCAPHPAIGAPFGWGLNDIFQLGNGTTTSRSVPIAVTATGSLSGKTVTALQSGYGHTLALTSDGKLFSWGLNENGQLGDGTTINRSTPVAVNMSGTLAGKTVTAIAAGLFQSLALTSDGRVFAWGVNSRGQLGDGTTTSRTTPRAVITTGALAGKTVIAIAAGNFHSLALTSDRQIFAWGNNDGALGDGTLTERHAPVASVMGGVLAGKIVSTVAAGYLHSLALTTDGKAFAWGLNWYGALGDGTGTSRNQPVEVNMTGVLAGKRITAIDGGLYSTVALSADGQVFSWGRNSEGQLGTGTAEDQNSPVMVSRSGVLAGQTITAIAAGQYHYLALGADGGRIFGWGFNQFGQLGDGSTAQRNVPVATVMNGVLAGRSVAAIIAGGNHSLSLTTTGAGIVVEQPAGTRLLEGTANISFGVARTGTSSSRAFTIRNIGDDALLIGGITLGGANPGDFLPSAIPATLPGGRSAVLAVQFTPTGAGTRTATLQIASNDEGRNPFRITLTGTGTAPEIEIHDGTAAASELVDGQTGPVDFGRNIQGTPGTRNFTIANNGTAELFVSSVTVPPGYTVLNLPPLPLTMGIGQAAGFQISLTTLAVGTHAGSVMIASDDLDEAAFDFPITGEVFIPDPVSSVISTTTTLNRQTGLREQTIHITNDTTSTVPAYNLIIRGLPPGVEVNNASETRADGSFVVYIRQGMAPRSLQDIILEYYSPTRAPVEINPQLSTEVILNPLDLTVPAGGEGLAVVNLTRLTGGEMLLEFTTTPGRRYEVQFSRDGQSWQASLPSIRAASNRTQWLDRGLPRTDRHPAQDTSRFYRVREVAP